MMQFSGVEIVLPDRILSDAAIVIEGDRIVDVVAGGPRASGGESGFHLPGHYVVPGFIDVHVHGVEGGDSLDGGDVIRRIASRLPKFGVTAFCPTSVACAPATLRTMLSAVRDARVNPDQGSARVLPAHLESNFINPDYKGAQPRECLRLPSEIRSDGEFSGPDIVNEIARARPDVGIVTVAPELDGGLDLIRDLVRHGHHVSLGHSGASYDQAVAGIEAGARQATHLFNRMSAFAHRDLGLSGAVLAHEELTAEVICDGVHVHPSAVRIALTAKGPSSVMAITDGTAGSGLPRGARASLGGRPITVGEVASLDDGTIAGSVLTMDTAFRVIVGEARIGLIDAVRMCSTTPARALDLHGFGTISPGAMADVVVLDPHFRVVHTCIGGRLAWSRDV